MHLPALGGVRWRKVTRDLREYRIRSLLVVLSIAVGVIAVGTIAGANALLVRNLAQGFADTKPASAGLFTTIPFDQSLVDIVKRMPDVAEAQGRRSATARMQLESGDTVAIALTALPDFLDQPMDLVSPESGSWPPRRGEVVFERSSSRLVPELAEGKPVVIQIGPDKTKTLTTGGFAKEPGGAPAYLFGQAIGYVTFDTLRDLGYDDSFDELRILVAGGDGTRAFNRDVATEVKDRLDKAGAPVAFTQISTPGEHPAQDLLNAVFMILGAIGLMSLAVSGFLVINTISAIMSQQTRQIGIMKAVGGRDGQIAVVYVGIVLGYALIALAIALPGGALGAWALTSFTAALLNFEATQFYIEPSVIAIEIAIGLLVPLLAAAWPVYRGVKVTVREAIAGGTSDGYGRSRFDRALQRLKGFSRPTLLSIRNTFRRKSRLVLTLLALTLGGAVFMSVFTLRASLMATLDDTLSYFDYDVQIQLVQPARTSILVRTAEQVPGVAAAEPWTIAQAQRLRPDDSTSGNQIVFGLPDGATTVKPVVEEGRFLVPGDGNALVVTRNFLDDETDVKIGDRVTLRTGPREAEFTLVGIVQSPTQRPFLYAPSAALDTLTRDAGKSQLLMLKTAQSDPASQRETGAAVRDTLDLSGMEVAQVQTLSEIRATIDTLYTTMLVFVSVMSLLLGVVGGLGLAGTMTMNVVERSREIGVMRAIGARDRSVLAVFMVEGLLIGALAWFIGVVVSLPISKVLSDALGNAFLDKPLVYTPAADGIIYWFIVVAVLALVASFLPAFRATRLAVREVLAYE